MNEFTNWLMGHDEISLSDKQRSTHTYVIGQSGTGKSRALESWIMQDILAGHGVGVMDPHGDLYNHLVAKLANQRDEISQAPGAIEKGKVRQQAGLATWMAGILPHLLAYTSRLWAAATTYNNRIALQQIRVPWDGFERCAA